MITTIGIYSKHQSKLMDVITSIKDVITFPFAKVSEGDEWHYGSEFGKSSDSPWLRSLKAKNFKENRIPGSPNSGWTNYFTRKKLELQKSKSKKYLIVGLLVTAAIVTSSFILKHHLDELEYERKRLDDLKKKIELNEATEKELAEAIQLSENVLQICSMEDPNKTEVAIDELQDEIISKAA